jgi:hypothetical protein
MSQEFLLDFVNFFDYLNSEFKKASIRGGYVFKNGNYNIRRHPYHSKKL